MSVNSAISRMCFDGALVSCAEDSQKWILSAMASHGPGIVTMLWRILGNEDDVCDAYQQTFLKLAHFRRDSRPDNVPGYLYRTASNVAISMLRRAKIHRNATERIASNAPGSSSVDYAHEIDSKVLQSRLRVLIARLPEYLRDVIMLRDLAEMPYAEVGRILDMPAGTARVYRFKAVTLLGKWMNPEQG